MRSAPAFHDWTIPSTDLLIIASSDESIIAADRWRVSSPISAERTVDATTVTKSSGFLGLLMKALAPRSRQTFFSFVEEDEVSTITGVRANAVLARIASSSFRPSTCGKCKSITQRSGVGVDRWPEIVCRHFSPSLQ